MRKLAFAKSPVLALSVAAIFTACQHPLPEELPCIEQKIEAFKTELDAQKIIKINAPDRTLYWFVDSLADGGEDIVDENCGFVCVTDIEGVVGVVMLCDDTVFNAGDWETIWEK